MSDRSPASPRLQDRSIYSPALCRHMRVHVYLPPDYDPANRYPGVYLLHPWHGSEQFWTDTLALQSAADHLIQAGAIPPFIAIMPQGDKSYFINAADPGGDFSRLADLNPDYQGALDGYGDYGDYIMQDVITNAERIYPLRTDRTARVIAGVEMGATGAAVLAFTYPDRFGAAGIHSPVLYEPGSYTAPPWIFGLNDPAAFHPRDPVQLAGHMPHLSGLTVFLDCAMNDESAHLTADLHYALVNGGVRHTYLCASDQDGTSLQSSAEYWRTNLAQYLGFYAAGW